MSITEKDKLGMYEEYREKHEKGSYIKSCEECGEKFSIGDKVYPVFKNDLSEFFNVCKNCKQKRETAKEL